MGGSTSVPLSSPTRSFLLKEDRELLHEAIEAAHRRRAAIQAGEVLDGHALAYWSFFERMPVEHFENSTGRRNVGRTSGAILPFRWQLNLTEQGKIEILSRPSREALRALASTLFRYPADLLVCEQHALVVEMAEIAAELRLWLPFGRFGPRPSTPCP